MKNSTFNILLLSLSVCTGFSLFTTKEKEGRVTWHCAVDHTPANLKLKTGEFCRGELHAPVLGTFIVYANQKTDSKDEMIELVGTLSDLKGNGVGTFYIKKMNQKELKGEIKLVKPQSVHTFTLIPEYH